MAEPNLANARRVTVSDQFLELTDFGGGDPDLVALSQLRIVPCLQFHPLNNELGWLFGHQCLRCGNWTEQPFWSGYFRSWLYFRMSCYCSSPIVAASGGNYGYRLERRPLNFLSARTLTSDDGHSCTFGSLSPNT